MALTVFGVSQFVQAASPDRLVMLTRISTDRAFADRTGHPRRVAQIVPPIAVLLTIASLRKR